MLISEEDAFDIWKRLQKMNGVRDAGQEPYLFCMACREIVVGYCLCWKDE